MGIAERFKRIALVNPPWEFDGSSYWACREPHMPLELLYAQALLQQNGLAAEVVDAHLEGLSQDETAERVGSFRPDLIAVTTAPSYLFWRCPPPELDVPAATCRSLSRIAPVVAVGPHGSATPYYTMDRLGCWAVIRGEPEMELVRVALGRPAPATLLSSDSRTPAQVSTVDVAELPPLDYNGYPLEMKTHRHHIFWGEGLGAEVEFSRGCPYECGFCNRRFFRGRYRERPIDVVLAELRRLRSRGIDYVYFVDELFGLGNCDALLEVLSRETIVRFGCETRIDLWDESRLDRLAAAGCISLELGLESPFPEVRAQLDKGCHITADRTLELMVHAKSRIPWVQADLVEPPGLSPDLRRRTEEWRQEAIGRGVWVSEPVRLFPYPGSKLHDRLLGPITDNSWIKAKEHHQTCGS